MLCLTRVPSVCIVRQSPRPLFLSPSRSCSSNLGELLVREETVGPSSMGGHKNRPNRYHPYLMSLRWDGEARHRAFTELTDRVKSNTDCWAWHIQNLAFMVGTEGKATNMEANMVMKACQMDIVDLFPAEQKVLTELVWESVDNSHIDSHVTDQLRVDLYNNMVEAYTFQEMEVDDQKLMLEMSEKRVIPNQDTYLALMRNLATRGLVNRCREFLDEASKKGIPLSEMVAKAFILGHASLGQIREAELVLSELNNFNIHWGEGCYRSFVIGCAMAGDVDQTRFFLEKVGRPSDGLLLRAVQAMNRKHPDRLQFLFDRLPVVTEEFSNNCRRTVKVLLETGNEEAAWQLVYKTRMTTENNSDKERVIRISPSVMVLKEFLMKCECEVECLKKISGLISVDPKIVSRSVIVLLELCFEDNQRIGWAKSVIQQLLETYPAEKEHIANYIGQNSKRRMKDAKEDDQVYTVFGTFSRLGLSLEKYSKYRTWDIMLMKLIPTIPSEGSWTKQTLLARCWDVRNRLIRYSKEQGGVVSNSVIWGHVMQHLLNRENELFFSTSATLGQDLRVCYAPKRWVLSLANCLLKLKDAETFVDILEVTYYNCERKGDLIDYEIVASSLIHVARRGQRQKTDVGTILTPVLDLLWSRKISLPVDVRDTLCRELEDEGMARAVQNIPVLGKDTFRKEDYLSRKQDFVRKRGSRNRSSKR